MKVTYYKELLGVTYNAKNVIYGNVSPIKVVST